MSRVFQNKANLITQGYKAGRHNGIDLVGAGHSLDYIVAHSDGVVAGVRANYATCDGAKGNSYGNYVLIRHDNGMYTMYAHMKYGSVSVKLGQRVSRGQVLGYMGNTGNSLGAHLHFEVRDRNNKQIDPTAYIDADLPNMSANANNNASASTKYKVGDVVSINGVYKSSTDTNKLNPAKKNGKITKIVVGARNPYLLENGNIGWVNDSCIVSNNNSSTSSNNANTATVTVTNCKMLNLRTSAGYGNNIYKAVSSGTKVELIGEKNGWAKVRYEGKTLYCGKSFLK